MSGYTWDDPEVRAYLDRAQRELIPKVMQTSVTIALWSGSIDPKNAIELGYMVMLDKPIILLVEPGTKVPRKLVAVADDIIEGGLEDPTTKDRLIAAMGRHGAGA